MATKEKPGEFDCYANAKPDEPMFVLLARDELAPWITRLWAFARSKNEIGFNLALEGLRIYAAEKGPHNQAKIEEAITCADNMEIWNEENPDV